MKQEHPAVPRVLDDPERPPFIDDDRGRISLGMTTSVSLARALSIGLLSRLDTGLKQIDVWDPAAGTGFTGLMMVRALEAAGIQVRYRGQDIVEDAVEAARARFGTAHDAEFAYGDVLAADGFDDFAPDLVLVDPPFATGWAHVQSTVEARRAAGEYRFGLPQKNDSTWLFISLALEKLRPADQGGGRVAALVAPRSSHRRWTRGQSSEGDAPMLCQAASSHVL